MYACRNKLETVERVWKAAEMMQKKKQNNTSGLAASTVTYFHIMKNINEHMPGKECNMGLSLISSYHVNRSVNRIFY